LECFHAGDLPIGFRVDQQSIHVEDNSIQFHRGVKLLQTSHLLVTIPYFRRVDYSNSKYCVWVRFERGSSNSG
jgi:hypothetical protein